MAQFSPVYSFIKDVKSLRPLLSIFFLISFSSIILLTFWLINIPELFKGGAKIGQIVYGLSFAYVSSFIFYFIVIHSKIRKDKENLHSYISGKIGIIIERAKSLIDEMAKKTEIKLNASYPDKSQLKLICEKINIYSGANILLPVGQEFIEGKLIHSMNLCKERSNEAIYRLLLQSQFLDSELINLLAMIEDCYFFKQISIILRFPIENQDLTVYEPIISKYFDLVKDLEDYYNKNFKDKK